uniref:Vomeronasal type-1 receptor n=1 Tax=Loxodonta africana TaxID=9785 RepID=G3UJE4_LOXAF
SGKVALKTISVCLIGVGTLANVFLFFHNVSPILFGPIQMLTHMILVHLAVANSLVLLSTGIPYTMAVFGFKNPLSSLGCKLAYFIHRMARSTSLCSICVLSTYQLVILISMRSGWVTIRRRASKAIGPSCYTCWMFSVLINSYIPKEISGPREMRNDTYTHNNWFCSSLGPTAGIIAFLSAMDVMFIGLVVWASGSMVLLLRRHHKKVRHIHTPNHSQKCVPETTATHTIQILVVTFVIFYTLDSICIFFVTIFLDLRVYFIHAAHILDLCFPTVSPFLLIFRD